MERLHVDAGDKKRGIGHMTVGVPMSLNMELGGN